MEIYSSLAKQIQHLVYDLTKTRNPIPIRLIFEICFNKWDFNGDIKWRVVLHHGISEGWWKLDPKNNLHVNNSFFELYRKDNEEK